MLLITLTMGPDIPSRVLFHLPAPFRNMGMQHVQVHFIEARAQDIPLIAVVLVLQKGRLQCFGRRQCKWHDDTDDETSLGLRFGFMRFTDCSSSSGDGTNYSSGCNRLINPLDTHYSTIWSSVNGQTAAGGTHLAAALNEAKIYLNYHKSQDNAADCRQKFVILVTDGADTLACSGDGTEDQQTQYKRRRETVAKVKALADSGYKVFVVGFGAIMPHWLRNTLNWAAYYGGTKSSANPSSPGSPIAYNPSNYSSCQSSSTSHHDIESDGDHYYASSGDPGELPLSGYAFLASSAEDLGTAIKGIARYIADLAKVSVSYVAPCRPDQSDGEDKCWKSDVSWNV